MFFAAPIFEGLWVVSIRTTLQCTLVCMSLISASRKETTKPNKYCLWEVNLISYIKIFSFINQSVNLVRKIAAAYDVGCVFAYFFGGHKNNFPLWFRSSFNIEMITSWNVLLRHVWATSSNLKQSMQLKESEYCNRLLMETKSIFRNLGSSKLSTSKIWTFPPLTDLDFFAECKTSWFDSNF